jgi:Flp pilus assembly protein TadG
MRLGRAEGNELIEFALVLPLLILLLAGTVEFGRAFYTYNILTKSVRNAARYLSASQVSLSGVVSAVHVERARNLAMYGNVAGTGPLLLPNLNAGNITVSNVAVPGPSVGQFHVTVGADYPYAPIFGFLLSDIRFQPKVTMEFVGVTTGT